MKFIIALNLLFIIFLTLLKISSFNSLGRKNEKIVIYGLVHKIQFGSEAAFKWSYQIVSASAELNAIKKMKANLKDENPNSSWIKVSSSKYDYNSGAEAMCIIKYYKKVGSCSYSGFIIDFGKTKKEAVESATKLQKQWINFEIKSQIKF
ncbi:hypothetical protein [Pedobacter mucosus]|uniref:hypothetical protein n=1 Tax=Pedobacter mucosus TaxID=2895286 RepID=UPI001EE440B5|nr:hypothetical protein [Pedobacter mucosus]UKT63195.1 hypothetical protein LOK61_15630 [Pedobacter mucosus]